MATKYNKTILARESIYFDGYVAEVYVLDSDADYYDIHIVMPQYVDDEMNTLELQEPKSDVTQAEATDKMFLYTQGLQKILWHKFYGHKGNLNTFSITVESEKLD